MATRHVTAALIALTGLGCGVHFRFDGPARVGSGIVAKQHRETPQFRRVQVGGATQVIVTLADNTDAEIEFDDNLLDIVSLETRGDTLIIRTRESYNSKHSLKVRLSTPQLKSLVLSGASTAHVDGVSAQEFELELSGASSATVNGTARKLSTAASGASKVRCFELITESTTATLSGASSAEVYATASLSVNASGASSLRFRGSPKDVKRQVSGASSIQASNSPPELQIDD
jgi:hypothetical protein